MGSARYATADGIRPRRPERWLAHGREGPVHGLRYRDGPREIFAATTGGLLVFDEAFQRLDLPITVEDGYPPVPPTAMVYDHRDGSLWLAAAGELLQFDPFSRRFRDRVPVRQVVTDLVPAEAAGSDLFVRMRGEWWRLDTFSRDLRRASPASVLAAIESRSDLRAREEARRDPFFLDAARQAVRASHTGPVRILDLVPGRDAYGWWLGTAGESVVQYDDIGRVGSRVSVGPTGSGMAAVLAQGGEVWFAPDQSLEGRYAVAAVTSDLQKWRAWRADSSRAVPDRVTAFSAAAGGMWAGGESGLHWMRDGGEDWTEVRDIDLSFRPVLSLAPASGRARNGVWVGSSRSARWSNRGGRCGPVPSTGSTRCPYRIRSDSRCSPGGRRGRRPSGHP